MPPYIFSVEGNIGSGKSTLVQFLRENFKKLVNREIIYLQEPVYEWKTIVDKDGKNIIEKYYNNQTKYSFSFQMMAYISRLTQLKKAIACYPNAIIITERCVHTDKNVFAKMLYDDDKIELVNYTIYNKWFDEFIADVPITGYIYLTTSPDKCLERIKKRNRKGEIIPLDYLINCNKYHESWLAKRKNIKNLDGNIDFLDEQETTKKFKEDIRNFIKSFLPCFDYEQFNGSCDYNFNIYC